MFSILKIRESDSINQQNRIFVHTQPTCAYTAEKVCDEEGISSVAFIGRHVSRWTFFKRVGGYNIINRAMEEIKIGNQIWMKKNLDVETFRNGDAILHAKTDAEWVCAGDQGKPAWCYYENAELYGEKYGKLYNWFAVNDPRGLAPKGWRVPSDKEWDKLVEYLGGEAVAGERMKTIHGWEENGNGTDQVGFSGLPGGYRAYGGTFDSIGDYGDWWSNTDGGEGSAWFRSLSYGGGDVYKGFSPKESGFSVRCLSD